MKALFVMTAITSFAISSTCAAEVTRKQVKTSKGQAVVLTRLVNTLPNCRMGPVPVPAIVEKPKHGSVQLVIVPADIAATPRCPAHKADAITIIYAPAKEYTGADNMTFELVAGNRTILVSYTVSVEYSL